MQSMVKTRFAPSPTGDLHIGGVRTALFAWAFARHHQGQFVLRIEDTDTARSSSQATETILEALQWLGLDYDEGPYFQSQRVDRYQMHLKHLLETRYAYRCDCTPERLDKLRNEQQSNKQKPRYDGFCRERNLEALTQPHVIRFRNPENGHIIVQDQIHGAIRFENTELDDLILVRSDGTPTYNFTVVVDDFEMGITHVIRGDDHLNNTPRQLNILHALKETVANTQVLIPTYAHLPMIRGSDGKKLSKRTGALSVTHYRELGYLPEALINYLARLGWSHGDQEIFSRQELIQYFDGTCLNKASATLNPEKLLWLNQHYLKHADPHRLAKLLTPFLEKKLSKKNSTLSPALVEIVQAQQTRVKTIEEMAERSQFFYETPQIEAIPLAEPLLSAIKALCVSFNQLNEWTAVSIHNTLKETAEHFQLKLGALAQPLRLLLTGSSISPPLDTVITLLGKTQTITRIQKRDLLRKHPL